MPGLPMTSEDVDLIESQLDLTFPADYRAFVIDYPPALRRFAGEHEIFDTQDAVVQHTLERRLLGAGDRTVPEHFVVIGTSGSADYYFLDLSESPPPVMFENRESGSITTAAPSFTVWYEQLVELYGCADD